MTSSRSRALLLLAHGAKSNPDSSRPAYIHAEFIRRRQIFQEVVASFWREDPHWRQALQLVVSDDVFVIPFFMSDGYFTQQVIPRELQLTGTVTVRDSRRIVYGAPVGTHPSMTRSLRHAAENILSPIHGRIPAHREVTLVLVGHGTTKNEQSGEALLQQISLLEKEASFAAVLPAFMEQAPFDRDVLSRVRTPFVVVVPFFISDGLHSRHDVPVNIGFAKQGETWQNPVAIGSKFPCGPQWLWYAHAIGSEPSMADVILDRCRDLERHL